MITIQTDLKRYSFYVLRTIVMFLLPFSCTVSLYSSAPSNNQMTQYTDVSFGNAFDQKLSNNIANLDSINRHEGNGQIWSTVTKKKKKKKQSLSSTLVEATSESVVNEYEKGTQRYAVCAAYQALQQTKKIDHIIERHYDPQGKLNSNIPQECRELLYKPYGGYVDGRYTTFFPQAATVDKICESIKTVLADPDCIISSKKHDNALEVRKDECGFTTEVIISKRSGEWKVITAYPKLCNN